MTEAELCNWFQGVAEAEGFTVYNEWADYDQVLVRDDVHIGAEAKLRANADVLSQAIAGWRWPDDMDGPHHRAVLVPKASGAFKEVAGALGVVVFEQRNYPTADNLEWARDLERRGITGGPLHRFWSVPTADRYRWGKGVSLPEVVPDVQAGKPAPVRLTPWKLKAIRLCLRLRDKGYITVRDFKEFDVDPSRWRHSWLRPDGKEGRATRWVPIEGVELPDEQHPEVAAKLRETA